MVLAILLFPVTEIPFPEEIIEYTGQGKEVYVYFNNTIGDAFSNARSLIAIVNGSLS